MIAQLWELSQAAQPTTFHNALRALDNRGKLLRVYTQNIDAIEEKCGLTYGIPDLEKRFKSRCKVLDPAIEIIDSTKEPSPSECSKTSGEAPRCIPLHGTLRTLHCQICNHSFSIEDHLPSLSAGLPPQCPECTSMEETRQLIGKRARGIGKLRPSVVLYNEAHKDGEGVGGMVQKDLLGSSKGKGADLLLVVGTSLKVPGTKRMVREFSKALRSRASAAASTSAIPGMPSHRRPLANDEEPCIKTIYLNLEFPVPTREWEGVFDAWVQGDAQEFAQMLQEEIDAETKARECATEKKRKREEDISQHHSDSDSMLTTSAKTLHQAKRTASKISSSTPPHSSKRRKVQPPPTPPKTPPCISSQKLFLRIPPRPSRVYLVPEVYITAPPLSARKSTLGQPLITPEKSPARLNLATKAGRRAARVARAARTAVKVKTQLEDCSNSSLTVYDDDDDDRLDAHLLPDSFVRTVQYGLRGVGG